MATFLITYDLHDKSYETKLLEYIKALAWAKAAESSYAVTTSKSSEQIVTDIKKITSDKIQLYVLTISKPYYGYGPKEVNDWLDRNL
jgi:hypothetical protein